MSTEEGIVVVAQEGRFRLITDEGRAVLFVLAHDAALEPQDLADLQRAQARVRVRYARAPGLMGKVATRIEAAPPRPTTT